MRRHILISLLTVCLVCWTAGIATAFIMDQDPEVTRFLMAFQCLMRDLGKRAVDMAEMVNQNRGLAERSLASISAKVEGDQGKSSPYRSIHSKLEEILLLTGDRGECSDPAFERLQEVADRQAERDDKVFYLARLARLCPGKRSVQVNLGDLYYELCQFDMAVSAYKKALQLGDDPDTRTLLARAEQRVAEYKQGKAITVSDVEKLWALQPKSPSTGLVIRKVPVELALQTNQIRFDEWSCALKDEFKAQLAVVGQVLRDQFRDDATSCLLIEGHTDRRGPLERNDQLSRDRAESIKSWLVANFGLDPSRLRTVGYGPRRPYAATDDETGWALNRRVEFRKSGDADPGQWGAGYDNRHQHSSVSGFGLNDRPVGFLGPSR